MRLLLRILIKNRIFVLFATLEILALFIIYRNRSYQGSVMLSSARTWSGQLMEWRSGVVKYLSLDAQNALLAEENAQLLNAKPSFFQSIKVQDDLVLDTLYQQVYEVFPARIINSSHSKRNNYITLDKGTLHGVESGMGVIGPEGVIGVVKTVSKHYCAVLPLIHSRAIIGAQLKGTGYFGVITWKGGNYLQAQHADIPAQARLKPGDTLLTDERSGKFPSGVMVGIVEEAELKDGFTYTGTIRLSTDFSALREVYLVRNLHKSEREELEQSATTCDAQ